MDWSWPVDNEGKKVVADKIRTLLEARLVRLLGCEEGDLRAIKLGSLAHFLFLLIGDSETMGGFNASLTALRDLIGFELMWSVEKTEAAKVEEKVVIN
jgi:hypothetical protein